MPQVAQGGTVRLPATYEDSTGALVDPVTPLVDIINPSNVVVVNDAVPVRDSLGEYHYDFTAASNAPLGAWVARFSGTISGGVVTGDEPFTVLPPGSVGVGQVWLVQLGEFAAAMGTASGDLDALTQQRYEQAIAGASAAVSHYADRAFASPVVTEQRTFEYDGSGFLDVDDCSSITAITFSYSGVDSVLDPLEWTAEPWGGPVYTYVILPENVGALSPAMGFTRNLDVIYRERGWRGNAFVKVDATWGWPEVPEDVKQAVILTAAEMSDKPGGMRSEAIAGYSYTRDTPGLPEVPAIPERAKDLLAPYLRYKVG